MSKQLNREEAWALLTEYNQDPFHLHHARTVEGVMRYFAQELGYGDEVDFWGIVGLLHDLDFERYPDQHCIQSQEIMRERDLDERLIHATASHGYGITVDIQPEHEMEKVLFATDELTGLIGAAALMGSMLKLHPKIVVRDGQMLVDKKYRGSLARCIPAYTHDLHDDLLRARPERVFITHSGCDPEVVEQVRTYLTSLNYFDAVIETRAGGVISCHCGPGTLGVLFILKE